MLECMVCHSDYHYLHHRLSLIFYVRVMRTPTIILTKKIWMFHFGNFSGIWNCVHYQYCTAWYSNHHCCAALTCIVTLFHTILSFCSMLAQDVFVQVQRNLCNDEKVFAANGYYQKINWSIIKVAIKGFCSDDTDKDFSRAMLSGAS